MGRRVRTARARASIRERVRVKLSSRGRPGDATSARSLPARRWTALAVVLALLFIVRLDVVTGDAPVQHLYYAPIVLAAVVFGWRGGLLTSAAAIVLYHAANIETITVHYRESDAIQAGLFVASGLVTARFGADARRLRRLAMTDDLTGLHNLRSFEAQLDAIIKDACPRGAPVSMLVIDVDRLKALNDTYGHLAGAAAVREVGHLIAATMPPSAVACRYGGDEFAVVLPGDGASEAVRTAARLCEAVQAAAPELAGRRFAAGTLSVSVGVASWSCGKSPDAPRLADAAEMTGERLFRAADAALYAAKEGGRNQVVAER
jgi:diguanylate cyclase (GGDEF)-like protein